MRKDKIYWAYRRQSLVESYSILLEDRQLAKHNADLIIANDMLHAGHSASDAIAHLELHHPNHTTAFLHHWYKSGGNVPTLNYIRAASIKAFDIDESKVHQPTFEGKLIHPSLLHDDLIKTIRNFNRISSTQLINSPDKITIYRGIGLPSNIAGKDYVPHALESWTSDLDSAKQFAHKSHIENSIPHVFQSTVNRNDIFTSHLASKVLAHVIPQERELVGKQEFIPFGDRLNNIERIE